MTKYLLDLTEAKLSKSWPRYIPKKIRVITGIYFKEFDVASEELEREWANRYRAEMKKKVTQGNYPPFNEDLPIGFNRSDLPPGAKLVKLP